MKILGKTYTVKMLPSKSMDGSLGCAHVSTQEIKISTEQSAESKKDTLLHEIVHVIDIELKIGLTEEDVCRLAVGLFSCDAIKVVMK